MVMGDKPPPPEPDDGAPRAPRGPFCIPLSTSMRPTVASLDSCEHYQSVWPTRLLGENVKIYSAEPVGRNALLRGAPAAKACRLTQNCRVKSFVGSSRYRKAGFHLSAEPHCRTVAPPTAPKKSRPLAPYCT